MKSYNNTTDSIVQTFKREQTFQHQASRIGLLKVQSYQFAMKTPEVGKHYQDTALEMVCEAFFHFISPSEITEQELIYYN